MTKAVLKAAFGGVGLVAVYLGWTALSQLDDSPSLCEVPVVVEVLNGCGREGVAEKVGEYLREKGFDVMFVGNADDFEYTETLVVDRCGDRSRALEVARALQVDAVIRQVSSIFFVDATVVVGGDGAGWLWGQGQ